MIEFCLVVIVTDLAIIVWSLYRIEKLLEKRSEEE